MFFTLNAPANAQTYVRTEHVGSNEVRVYETMVVVHKSAATSERKAAYEELRESVASLANIRIESRNELVVKEQNKKHSESFTSKIRTITLADVEIVPLRETLDGEWLRTEVEVRVTSLPIPKDALSWEIEPNSLFDRMPIRYGQKYLIRFREEINFNPNQLIITENFDVQGKEWLFKVWRLRTQNNSAYNVATLGRDRSFLVHMNRNEYSGIDLIYDDGVDKFSVLIARPGQKKIKPYGKGEVPTVSEMLEWFSQPEFSSRIEIKPAFEVKARKIGG